MSKKSNATYYVESFRFRFLRESNINEILSQSIISACTAALESLGDNPTSDQVYAACEGCLLDIAKDHADVSYDKIRQLWFELAQAGSIPGLVVNNDEDYQGEDDLKSELETVKEWMTPADLQKLKANLKEAEKRIRAKLKKENAETDALDAKTKEKISAVVKKHCAGIESITPEIYGAITQDLIGYDSEILSDSNPHARLVIAFVDQLIKDLDLDTSDVDVTSDTTIQSDTPVNESINVKRAAIFLE